MQRRVLTVNSGSSSIKYAVYEGEKCLLSGKLENLGAEPRAAALNRFHDELRQKNALEGVTAVGYRIVHGGMHHSEPERLTPELLQELRTLAPLAPDHLPDQILAIEFFNGKLPELEPVACFDTAFHRTMPRIAQLYGLTRELADEGIVRYGFHGLSYAYLVDELRRRKALPERTVIAHLGNGASMVALRDGVSVDTSMGFTPTGGFAMSNRSGDLDPGVVLHLIRQMGWSADAVNELVSKKGGLKGLSGISSDMRELEASSDPRAKEAIEVFCYQIRKFIGSYSVVLGGIDLLVFAGGIGENSELVRHKVSEGLGIADVRVVATNEEVMIARYTNAVLRD